MIDLLKYSGNGGGGCSAKIPQDKLSEILSRITPPTDENVMVDISTGDDAGVYRLDDERALIVTTDFFPPVCSDAYDFGQIAAANSLSDVYAMGGKPLLVLNLNMFPSKELPIDVLGQILEGGQSKINESGALVMGGHTIDDLAVKYGLAVVGICHPDKLVTNSGAKAGQTLILTKPLGVGVATTARRMGMATDELYNAAIATMKQLNDKACQVMTKHGVTGGTDITGFGLVGHLNRMAQSSNVSMNIDCQALPILKGIEELLEQGCVPGSAFHNLRVADDEVTFAKNVTLERKMLCCDAQTSGGLLMAIDSELAVKALEELHHAGCLQATIIGTVTPRRTKSIYFV